MSTLTDSEIGLLTFEQILDDMDMAPIATAKGLASTIADLLERARRLEVVNAPGDDELLAMWERGRAEGKKAAEITVEIATVRPDVVPDLMKAVLQDNEDLLASAEERLSAALVGQADAEECAREAEARLRAEHEGYVANMEEQRARAQAAEERARRAEQAATGLREELRGHVRDWKEAARIREAGAGVTDHEAFVAYGRGLARAAEIVELVLSRPPPAATETRDE